MNLYSKSFHRNNHNGILFNSVLWLFLFVVLLFVFSDFPIEQIDLIYTISYLVTLVVPVVLSIYYLIPRYLKEGNNLVFIILLTANILFFYGINFLFHNKLIDFLFPEFYFVSYVDDFTSLFVFLGVILFAVSAKLLEDWLYLNQKQKTMLQLELAALKNQINPHFLFNALNVLYSLSINKKEETTTAILNLSDILRYVIYEATDKKISIQKEVELIKSYIDFEKKRNISDARIEFKYKIEKEMAIFPMILLPLIENAFKHGLKSGVENPYIEMDLSTQENQLLFTIENNYLPMSKEDDHFSGVGLENVKKQLEILYENNYNFTTSSGKEIYTTTLSITNL